MLSQIQQIVTVSMTETLLDLHRRTVLMFSGGGGVIYYRLHCECQKSEGDASPCSKDLRP